MKTGIKNSFIDIFSLYKNFIHWNVSKIVLFILSFIIGILSAAPFVLIYFIFTGFSIVDLSILLNSVFVSGQALPGVFANIMYLFIVISFTVGYFYYYILLLKLYLYYLSGKKVKNDKKFTGKLYKEIIEYVNENVIAVFKDYKTFIKYLGLAFTFCFILAVPFVVGVVLSLILIAAMGGVNEVTNIILAGPNNVFTIIFGLFLLLSTIFSAYLGYRFIFSFFLLLEKENKKLGIIELLKKSFGLTKSIKKIFKLFFIGIVVFIAILPFNIIGGLLSIKSTDLDNYVYYNSLDENTQIEVLNGQNSSYFNGLLLKYDSVEMIEVLSDKKTTDLLLGIFSIFQYLVLNGLFIMVLASFYKRLIIKK